MSPSPRAPLALPPHRFPFRALAARAGRASLGGERESALACLMVARLATGLLPVGRLLASQRLARAQGARGWLATLALPSALRIPLARVVDASAGEDALRLAGAVRALSLAAAPWLDQASRAELERLALTLGGDAVTAESAAREPLPSS